MSTHRTRRSVAAIAACGALVVTGALAGCSSDDDSASSTTSTTAATGSSTTAATGESASELATVSDVWAEPTEDTGGTVKVYASILGGKDADTLVGVTVEPDVAEGAALTPESTVKIPATQVVNLDSSGTHIELTGLAAPLEYNRAFHVTFEFENAGALTVEGAVRNPTDPESDNQ